jgi:hypothetical protein
VKRAKWTRLSDPKASKCDQHWRHESGYEVKHCGHPTAIWPWYVVDPADRGLCLVSQSGYAFRKLSGAMDAVEGLVAGQLVALETSLSPGHVRRIVASAEANP